MIGPAIAFNLAVNALGAIATALNAFTDVPHEPESRPARYEACWQTEDEHITQGEGYVWLEVANVNSYVCDRSGLVLGYTVIGD